MKLASLKRSWTIGVGLACVGAIAVTAIVFSTQRVMDELLYQDAINDGMAWAQYVVDTTEGLSDVISGKAPASDVEEVLGQFSAVGNIYQFAFFSANGELLFKTGSFHPQNEMGTAAYHAHAHEADAALGADTQMMSKNAAVNANAGMDMHVVSENGDETSTNLMAHAQHLATLMVGDGVGNPIHYAVVNHPVMKNGILQYTIRLRLDQTERFDLYKSMVSKLSILLAAIASLAVGIPALFAWRSRNRAEIANQQVHFLAKHDSLTGLLNRRSFLNQLEHAFATRRGQSDQIGLFIIDLDGFKVINDGFGHDVGDELLRQLADSLKYQGDDFTAIARLGGDEFAAFVTFDSNNFDLHELANYTLSSLTGIYEVNGHDVVTTASIGIALAPSGAETAADLMQKADIALYAVKTNGRNGYALFKSGMEKKIKMRRNLEALLRQARHDKSFELHFQPLFDQETREITAFETLVRMRDEKGAFVPPDTFIPVVEDMGMMEELGEFILQEATKTATHWPDHIGLAVNLSPKQFESGNLVRVIRSALEHSGLNAKRLELEITESLLMNNSERNLRQLTSLKELGVSIAMDDFGTGYSSLGYLWKFPFDKIKIDKSFMGDMEHVDAKATQIVSTIIALGHTLEMCVTAEGVETEAQAKFLNEHKCDQLQGFLLGRPMPSEEIDGFIRKGQLDEAHLKIVS